MRAGLFLVCAILLTSMGCQSVKEAYVNTIPIANTTIALEMPNGQMTTLKVRSSLNEHSRAGIKHYALQELQQGVDALALAIEAKPGDHHSQFALGVGHEKLGQFKDALTHYKKAIFHSSSKDIVYAASKRRAQFKLDSNASR